MMSENVQGRGQRIVVGVDLSETGDHALREAMSLCRRLPESELHVSYVIHVDRNLHDARKLEELAGLLRVRMNDLRAHVERVCQPGDREPAYQQETIFHVRLGDPTEALHQVAIDVEADLLVVGTHARRGVEKLMLGSVAEELIRTARLPVLVARPKDLSGMRKSDRAEPARAGESFEPAGLTDRLHLEFVPRNTRISGLV